MKTERPPPPFVKTFHKIPVFFKGWLPLPVSTVTSVVKSNLYHGAGLSSPAEG